MSTCYHKIHSLFKRDEKGRIIPDEYARPEFDYLSDNLWEVTEKVDGTNIRVIVSPSRGVTFGGRTDNAQLPAPLVKHLQERFLNNEALIAQFPDGAVIYGEGYGGKIQKKGSCYGPEQRFIMFDISVGKWWLRSETVTEIAYQFDIPRVPVIGTCLLKELPLWVAHGMRSTFGNFEAEGVVARPTVELCTRSGERIITKLKVADYAALSQ